MQPELIPRDLYSIILPTYNERKNLPILMELIEKYLTDIMYEVIIVDDNSPDGTLLIAEKLVKLFGEEKIKIVSRAGKLGLGTAYIDGYKVALGKFIILMDCDLSHHPKYIKAFIDKQIETGCDIVTGTRYKGDLLDDGSTSAGVCGWDLKRKIISSGANTLIHMLLDAGVSDLTGSFRLYKRDKFEKLLSKVTSRGFSFQMEMMIMAKMANLTVEEVPIIFFDRYFGNSKISINEILHFLNVLLSLATKKYSFFGNNNIIL